MKARHAARRRPLEPATAFTFCILREGTPAKTNDTRVLRRHLGRQDRVEALAVSPQVRAAFGFQLAAVSVTQRVG